jgi:hypothetical protein
MVVGGLLAVTAGLAVLAGVTAVLWWAGQVRVPVLVLVYGPVAMAAGGFVVGRASRAHVRQLRLPQGPGQITWQPGAARVHTGLVWEKGPEAAGYSASPPEESRP